MPSDEATSGFERIHELARVEQTSHTVRLARPIDQKEINTIHKFPSKLFLQQINGFCNAHSASFLVFINQINPPPLIFARFFGPTPAALVTNFRSFIHLHVHGAAPLFRSPRAIDAVLNSREHILTLN
jgi:hypothetical protein